MTGQETVNGLPDRTYATPARRELHGWLAGRWPELADLYAAALQMLFDSKLPQKSRLVAHALREINSRLPDCMLGEKAPLPTGKRRRLQPTQQLNEIAQKWNGMPERSAILPIAVDSAPAPGTTPISTSVFSDIDRLVTEWLQSYESFPAKVERAILQLVPENRAAPEIVGPAAKQWSETSAFFASVAHAEGRNVTDAEMVRKLEIFEQALSNVVGVANFYPLLNELDEILGRANG
jgi:hypothetical protein